MEYPITLETLFVTNLEERISFIEKLAVHEFEVQTTTLPWAGKKTGLEAASVLCVAYIGACANFYNKKSHLDSLDRKKFINILIELGGNPIFSAIHPRMLREYIEKVISKRPNKSKSLKIIFDKIKHLISDSAANKFYSHDEFMILMRKENSLSDQDLREVVEILSEGSFAAISYHYFRNTAVHELVLGKYTFSESTFAGKPVEDLGFPLLFAALKNILENFKTHAKNKTT